MNTFSLLRIASAACVLCAIGACSHSASPSSTSPADPADNAAQTSATSNSTDGDEWVHNGATACDKYLTPDFVGQIFKNPAGQNKKSDSQNCTFETAHQPDSDFSTIYIYLQNGTPDTFDMDPTVRNGTPIQGVGDKAVRTQEDGVTAVKGDRKCNIFVKPPFDDKLKGEAMAQKLGEVCNKLFALP